MMTSNSGEMVSSLAMHLLISHRSAIATTRGVWGIGSMYQVLWGQQHMRVSYGRFSPPGAFTNVQHIVVGCNSFISGLLRVPRCR